MSESAKKRKIVRKCKLCNENYFKKALNQFNKDICDSCKPKHKTKHNTNTIPAIPIHNQNDEI